MKDEERTNPHEFEPARKQYFAPRYSTVVNNWKIIQYTVLGSGQQYFFALQARVVID